MRGLIFVQRYVGAERIFLGLRLRMWGFCLVQAEDLGKMMLTFRIFFHP